MRRAYWLGMLTAGIIGLAPRGVAAQEGALFKRVQVDFRGATLDSALTDIERKSGATLTRDSRLAALNDLVTFAADTEAGRAANQMLRPLGLKLALTDNGSASVTKMTNWEEIQVLRKGQFEFADKPRVSRDGDKTTIAFAVKEFCDATIAIENDQGKIVRHLASGLLGENAPEPFLWNTKKQVVVWDGKNDKGEYVDDKDSHTVRVSLGLKPRFERTLYWSPYKIGASGILLSFCTAPEGVYVYDLGPGRNSFTPWLKLFDHDGRFVHTLYPFAAADLERVQGLTWAPYPPDARKFAVKNGPLTQTNLLTWGDDSRMAIAAGKDYVYVVGPRINRIAKPGSGKPHILDGPTLAITHNVKGRGEFNYVPGSVALSPDHEWLYLTRYTGMHVMGGYYRYHEFLPCVMRMPADCSRPPEPLIGVPTLNWTPAVPQPPEGSVLANPMDVACDREGRLYVADIFKGLFVFSPAGKLLHHVKLDWPAHVQVDPATGEVWVMCWRLTTMLIAQAGLTKPWEATPREEFNSTLHRLSPCKDNAPPQVIESYVVPAGVRYNTLNSHSALVDVLAPTRRVWFCHGVNTWGTGPLWEVMNARIFEVKGRKAVEVASWDALAKRDVVQSRPPRYGRQRPYVNPADGCVYIAEQIQPTVVADVQCFDRLVRINPETGKTDLVGLPFDTEDLAFDSDGHAHLRTHSVIVRYDSRTWREIPFDYGEELNSVSHYGLRACPVSSGAAFNGGMGASGKLGGFGVNVLGHVVAWYYSTEASTVSVRGRDPEEPAKPKAVPLAGVKPWTPQIFPGRSTMAFIHIFDKHGKVLFEDAVRGCGETSDVEIDKDGNIFMIANMNRMQHGEQHPDPFINTLVKIPAGKGTILTDGRTPVPLSGERRPSRPPDAMGQSGYHGRVWLEGASWLFGGVGANNRGLSARACHCEANSGMALDYYGRSFVPALHRYEIVVVDTAGNAILRFGRYGSVEDGMPLVKDGGPANPRSIGGDEVSFISPKWMAVHSDRRLFVADRGNYRIMSVKLGYHTEEKVALKDVADKPGK